MGVGGWGGGDGERGCGLSGAVSLSRLPACAARTMFVACWCSMYESGLPSFDGEYEVALFSCLFSSPSDERTQTLLFGATFPYRAVVTLLLVCWVGRRLVLVLWLFWWFGGFGNYNSNCRSLFITVTVEGEEGVSRWRRRRRLLRVAHRLLVLGCRGLRTQ